MDSQSSFRDRRRGEAIAAAPAFQELRVLEQQLIEVNVAFGEADEKSCDQMSGCQIRSCVPRHFLSPIFTLTAIGTCGRALRQERRSRLLPTSWSKRHAAICYPSVFSRRSNPSESASSRALYKYNAQLNSKAIVIDMKPIRTAHDGSLSTPHSKMRTLL